MSQSPYRRRASRASRRSSLSLIQDVNVSFRQQGVRFTDAPDSPRPSSNAGQMRRAVRDLIHTVGDRRSKRSVYDPRGYIPVAQSVPSGSRISISKISATDFVEVDEEMMSILAGNALDGAAESVSGHFGVEKTKKQSYGSIENGEETNDTKAEKFNSTSPSLPAVIIQQVTAVTVVALLNMMMAIPFGASYFPVGWRAEGEENGSSADGDDGGDDIQGIFPLAGKQNIGLRMFLLATFIGQLVYTYKSKFANPVSLQMVENVPFMHALAEIVIKNQGYGKEALSTLFFLFGLSSIIVGLTFYALGRLEQGKIVYFFPNHVLVGCIGGIGVFIVITAMEVTTNTTFDIQNPSSAIQSTIIERWNLLWVILAFEVALRCLLHCTKDPVTGHPKYQLLSPIFYILITPVFYIGMKFIAGMSLEKGREAGYFFPSVNSLPSNGDGEDTAGLFNDPHIWDVFHIIDFSTISWRAVAESTGTMIALAAFRYEKK